MQGASLGRLKVWGLSFMAERLGFWDLGLRFGIWD